MNSYLFFFVTAVCVLCINAAPQGGAAPPSDTNNLVRDGNLALTVGLLNQIHHEAGAEENMLVSPFGMQAALAALHLGASGISRNELAKLLHLPEDESRATEAHKKLSEASKLLQTKPTNLYAVDSEVTIANGLFVQENYPVKEDYVKRIKEYYDGNVTNLDFAKNAKGATDAINQWVSDKTKSRIPKLYSEPLDEFTVFVLASSLYFNGRWKNAFPEDKTKTEKFYTGVKEVEVKLMNNQKNVPYLNNPTKQFEAITVPYDGGYKMTFVKPFDTQSLHNLTHQLTPEDLNQILSNVNEEGVDYKVPQTKFSYKKELKQTLSQLGLKSVFEKADLSNLVTSSAEIKISNVNHATEIVIDETGTMAASITSLQATLYSLPIPPQNPKPFYLNKPFLLFIHNSPTQTVLFAGVVHQPQQ